MNKFRMLIHYSFLRITVITDRAVVQSFLYMNWFSMFFQIDFFRRIKVKTLVCFLTSFLHENNWHVLQNVFSIKTKITNWAIIYLIFWINKFKVFSHFSFLRITMITDRAVVQYFLYMNWFSMLFGIEFFGRIIFTTCACFLTSCPHENNWHVFQNVYCRKTKITNWSIIWLIFCMNKFKMFLHFFFFLRIIMITYRAVE